MNVSSAFAAFTPNIPLECTHSGHELARWMRANLATTTVSELSRKSGLARSSLSRWVCGRSEPRVPDFLQFVDSATGRLPDLVAELVPIEAVPALLPRHRAALAAKRIAFDHPWTEALLRVLETRAYAELRQHDSVLIAAALGIDVQVVDTCLAALLEARLIERQDHHYRAPGTLTVDTQGGREALHALKSHWTQVAAQRALKPSPEDVFGYSLLSASNEDLVRIRAVLKNAYREVRAIVAASDPAETAALVNVQFVSWKLEEHD